MRLPLLVGASVLVAVGKKLDAIALLDELREGT